MGRNPKLHLSCYTPANNCETDGWAGLRIFKQGHKTFLHDKNILILITMYTNEKLKGQFQIDQGPFNKRGYDTVIHQWLPLLRQGLRQSANLHWVLCHWAFIEVFSTWKNKTKGQLLLYSGHKLEVQWRPSSEYKL